MLLAIDTSTRYAGVALADEERVVSCRVCYSNMNHTMELMPQIAESLEAQDIDVASLEGVAVALGPGGFSAGPAASSHRAASFAADPARGTAPLRRARSPWDEDGGRWNACRAALTRLGLTARPHAAGARTKG